MACQRRAPRSYSVVVTFGPARAVDGLEDLQALGDDLRADAVAADDGDVEGLRVASALMVSSLGMRYRDADGRPSPWIEAGRPVVRR